MNKRFEKVAFAAGLGSVLLASGARAMAPEIGTDSEYCQHPTVVRMPECTGIYMGNGLVITAGHCIDNVHPGVSKARFGENEGAWQYEIVIDHCVAHPDGAPATAADGSPSYDGPDIAYCILAEALSDVATTSGNTPVIAPMMPVGCERNWLAHQVYQTPDHAIVTVLGTGCSVPQEYWGQDCEDGVKRYASEQLTAQLSYHGSSTKLRLRRDLWNEKYGVYPGDSGGPVLMTMPDKTWRLVGVLHGSAADTVYAEAVPPYLHWIEQSSGIDVTPFHEFNGSSWVAQSGLPLLPGYEHNANWGLWTNTCGAAPRGASTSYNQPYLVSGFACSGWNLPPDDLTIQSQGQSSAALLSAVSKGSLATGNGSGTKPVVGGFVDASQTMTAPLPFLPLATHGFTPLAERSSR